MSETVSVSREIAAPAERVWVLVSDLPRMGEWSNENTGGKWVGGATGPAPGAHFRGSNRNGIYRWKTSVTVVDADPPERFSFQVSYMGLPVSEWAYDIEPIADGCHATETWTDRRPGWFKRFGRLGTGVADRVEHTRDGMTQTLDRLAAEAESASG